MLEAARGGPRDAVIATHLKRIDAKGHTPLRVANAVRRYRRWLAVNPNATSAARGTMLAELWTTYHLAEVERTAPETRVRFFRETVFVAARPELAAELDRLLMRARVAPFASLDVLGEQLAVHRAAVTPTPEEDYFLARMTYRYLAPLDDASLVVDPVGNKQLATVMIALHDNAGAPYFVRRPATPREVARLLELFHDASLPVAFQADSEVLLALDGRGTVIGGLFWHWLEAEAARMDKLVVARQLRGNGVGDGLLRELLRRLRGRGARRVSTGFFRAEYFKRHGFRTDPTSGGLVLDLEPVQEASLLNEVA